MKRLIVIFFLLFSVCAIAQTSVPTYELVTVSGTDSYTATASPAPALPYVNGYKKVFKFTNANTGAATFTLNGGATTTLRKSDGTALSSGDIPAGSVWWVVYDGTASQWRLSGGSGSSAIEWGDITGTLSNQTDLQSALDLKAPLASPALTGNPTAPTPALNDNSTKIATTEYVDRLSLTIGTGLTNTTGTLTANLSTGVSGGQSVIGGTASGNSLTLSSTSNATKGSIIFGASSYSEAANTYAYVLSGLSTTSSTWTGTASGQSAFTDTGTITGRSNASGGNADTYRYRVIDPTFVIGSGTSAQVFRGLSILGTYPVSTGGRAALHIDATMATPGAADYLIHAQAGGTDRFRVSHTGNINTSGATISLGATTSASVFTPQLSVANSGTNADLVVNNTASEFWRFRATNAAVFSLNRNGSSDIFSATSTNFTLNSNLLLGVAGNKITIKSGSNASAGTAVLVGGTVTVNTTAVGANSMVQLTSQVDGGTPGFLRITAKVNGTSFTITSSSGTDTSTVGWWILDAN